MNGKIRGVNLGNWLVIEKWMSEALFSGTDAMDETWLCTRLGPEKARERLKVHRDEFITERDFEEIAAMSFNAVRIPVPYFLFEDIGPFIHCYEYLDKAFDWAEKYGLKILVDLHTAPGGHNGTDNSGVCGICTWSAKQENVDDTVSVLEKIAERYGRREAMWGIEVLNEPMCSDTEAGKLLNIQNLVEFYIPVDKELAKQNTNYSLAFLRQFYRDAYTAIRRHMEPDRYVVFSDAFEREIWDDFLKEFEGVVLDTHNYLMTADMGVFREKNIQVYTDYLRELGKKVNNTARRIPLIVGEWNAQNQADGLAEMTNAERDSLYCKISEEFQKGMEDTMGWFYWSWKIHGTGGIDDVVDDACRCVQHGYLRVNGRSI